MTGSVADVCRFRSLDSAAASGVANFQPPTTGPDVEVAALSFDFDVQNTTNPSSPDIGAITDGDISLVLDMYCNNSFQFTVAATNGALVNTDELTNSADFTNRLTYDVQFNFPDGGAVLSGTSTGSAGSVIPTQNVLPQDGQGTVTISFSNPAGRKLISGLYQEAITISIVQDGAIPDAVF